jgi:hypothetical protein
VYVKAAQNNGKLFIYQVQTLFLAIKIFENSGNPFPGVMFKLAHQQLVQPVNIDTTMYMPTSMGIGEIWTIGKLPQPDLLSSRCRQIKVLLGVVALGPAAAPWDVIWAYSTSGALTIVHYCYSALLVVAC